VADGEHDVSLWLWADRIAVAPSRMDEQTWRSVYAGEISLGSATIEDVTIDGARAQGTRTSGPPRDVGGSVWRVGLPEGSAREVSMVVRFRVTLPERFGRLERSGDVLSLAGPWMPLVLNADGSWDARTRWRVSVETTTPRDVAIGDAVGS